MTNKQKDLYMTRLKQMLEKPEPCTCCPAAIKLSGSLRQIKDLIDEGYKLLDEAAIRIGPSVGKERNQLHDVIANMFMKSCERRSGDGDGRGHNSNMEVE